MRLRQIEIFYHVYRAGSISGAARNLNVSQPSVSKVLRHAEDQLGIDLFQRRKGRLVPTQAAHELYRDAQDIYTRLATFNASLANIASRRGNHIRLGVLPSLSLSVGPEFVARMRESDPDLSFELFTFHTDRMAQALFEKRCDLCVGFSPSEDPRLESKQVGEGSLTLVSGDPLAEAGEELDLAVLEQADFVGIRDSGPLGRLVSDLLMEHMVRPNEVVTTHTYHLALSLVRKRLGLAVTDQYSAFSHLAAGLHRYRLRDLPRYGIHALWLADHEDRDMLDRATGNLAAVVTYLDEGIASLQGSPPHAGP